MFISTRKALDRARIFKLLRTPGIDSTESIPCEKSIMMWNWFWETSIPCEGIEDFRSFVVIICCVWGRTPLQYCFRFPTFKQFCSCRQGDEKLISAFKNIILWGKADSIPYLVPTQLQKTIPPPPPKKNLSKNTGSEKICEFGLKPRELKIGEKSVARANHRRNWYISINYMRN